MNYERWLQQIDTYLAMMVGVSHQDLPDQPYRDWHCEYMNLRICESAYRPFAHSPILKGIRGLVRLLLSTGLGGVL